MLRMRYDIPLFLFFAVVIGTLLYYNMRVYKETFINGSAAGNQFAPRCGVEFPACPTGMKCINGYCAINAPPAIRPDSGLPVYPLNSGGRWGK